MPRRRPLDAPTPPKDTGAQADRLETSADSIEKRTAALQAEAGAIDLGTAARERSKITAQLETVAKQVNAAAGKGENVVTQEQRDRINEVADAYANAALAIEKAHIASNIKFGQRTALLDPQDAAIANQLKGIYPDVATALASVEAHALRTNDALRGISGTMTSTLTTGLTDILDGTKGVGQGFADMSKTIVRALEEAVIKMTIVAPLMRALQALAGGFLGGGASAGGGLLSGIGALFGFDSGGYTGPGGVHQPAGVVHKGEVIWSQRDVARAGGVGVVEAMRLGQVGYARGGAVALPGGSRPATPSGAVTVNLNNAPAGTSVEKASATPGPNGGIQLDVMFANSVRGVIRGDMASGTGIAPDLKMFASRSGFRGG